MARIDKYLKIVGGEEATPPPPQTRLDKSLYALATQNEAALPASISSIDKSLKDVVEMATGGNSPM